MQIRSVGAELFYFGELYRHNGGRTYIMKLTVAFRHFVNAFKTCYTPSTDNDKLEIRIIDF